MATKNVPVVETNKTNPAIVQNGTTVGPVTKRPTLSRSTVKPVETQNDTQPQNTEQPTQQARRVATKDKTFEQAALELYPELRTAKVISRRQVNDIVAKANVSMPLHIVNKENNVGRGLYGFNVEEQAQPQPVKEPEKVEEQAQPRARRVADKTKTFEQAVIELHPEMAFAGSITRKMINEVVDVTNVPWPSHVVNKKNAINRALYHFDPSKATVNHAAAIEKPQAPAVEKPMLEVAKTQTPAKASEESDAELEHRIKERYATMDELIEAVAHSVVNSLIISGAPGLGKSYETNLILGRINKGYVFHRGYLKATHLFRLLWENREKGRIVVIDDCDSIFTDETALNILKAALELKEQRLVSWGSERGFVDDTGTDIPRTFTYEGSVIFLTNLPISGGVYGKTAYHMAALESRSLALDLGIRTPREILAKIKMTLRDGMLKNRGLTQVGEREILKFMEENAAQLKELSLRTAEKLAALYMLNKEHWVNTAKAVCLK